MEKTDIEQIEAYLSGNLTIDENRDFEEKMDADPVLKQNVELVAMDIVSIKRVGLDRDQAKIDYLKKGMAGATKRMWTAAATVGVCALIAAAAVITPVYEFVVAPIIETIKEKRQQERQHTQPDVKPIVPAAEPDSIYEDTDSIIEEPGGEPAATQPAVPAKVNEPSPVPAEEEVKAEEKEPEPEPQPKTEEEPKPQRPAPQVTQRPTTNRVTWTSGLDDYAFSDVKARRSGNKVICTFTMSNSEEDAELTMHTARAKDSEGNDIPAKNCKLMVNGKEKKSSKDVENWKKGEAHNIEITIDNVDPSVDYLAQVSFTVRSKSKTKDQKNQKVVVEVGDIK